MNLTDNGCLAKLLWHLHLTHLVRSPETMVLWPFACFLTQSVQGMAELTHKPDTTDFSQSVMAISMYQEDAEVGYQAHMAASSKALRLC